MSFNPPIDHLCNGNLGWHPGALPQRWWSGDPNDSRRQQFFAKSMGVTGVFPWLSASVLQCFSASVFQVICSTSRRDSRRRSTLQTVMNEAPGTDWRFGGRPNRKHRRWQKHDRWIKPGRPLSFASRDTFGSWSCTDVFETLTFAESNTSKNKNRCADVRDWPGASKEELGHPLFSYCFVGDGGMIESTILTGDAHIVPTTHSGLHLCGVWHLGNAMTQWEHNVRTDLSPKHGM